MADETITAIRARWANVAWCYEENRLSPEYVGDAWISDGDPVRNLIDLDEPNDVERQFLELAAQAPEDIRTLLAYLEQTEQTEQGAETGDQITFQIAHLGADRLLVTLASASEMSFEVLLPAGCDYLQTITDICEVAPRIIRLDADLMEMHDGANVRPQMADQVAIRQFVNTYRDRIKHAMVGMDQFNGLEGS